jgi:ribosome-associated protein
MDIRKLQRTIVDGLEDVKAQDIAVFNTEQLSALFERVVIASGTSNRQTKALAASVRDVVREHGGTVLSVEGEDNGEWIIVDCGAAVVHIMQPAIRQYYHLEEIWGAKPVRMKLGTEMRGLPKASEPDEDEADAATSVTSAAKPAARRRSSSAAEAKAPARKAAVKRSAGGLGDSAAAKPAKPATKPAAKKAPAKAAGKTAARKTPARKSASAPVPMVIVPQSKKAVRKAEDKKAPARKTAAVKPAGKTAAKSAAAPRKSKPAA